MQKEISVLNQSEIKEIDAESEAQNTISSAEAETSLKTETDITNEDESSKETSSDDKNSADFDKLIKGPYKDAFAKKVQGIINKRFKEQKVAESKAADENKSKDNKITQEDDKNQSSSSKKDLVASTYDSLIEAGIDPETAYRVLHLDEIMDSSMRYGAELAAKQLTEALRKKSARPVESALSGRGYSAKTSASTLTPEKRKELAKKALMGEQIGF